MNNNPFLSFTMIVKNGERYIIRCLESTLGLVDEYVIVDTGSTDNTIPLIQGFSSAHPDVQVKILNFNWIDDFSAARNFGISECSGKYIFTLDADEYICPDDAYKFKQAIRYLKRSHEPHIVICTAVSVTDIGTDQIPLVKVFPNDIRVRFSRRIHEYLDESLSTFKHRKYTVDVKILTDGYSSSEDTWSKRKRNLRILNMMIQEDPNDYISLFYFARDLYRIRPDKSIELLHKVLPMIPDNAPFWKDLCVLYLNTYSEDIKNIHA